MIEMIAVLHALGIEGEDDVVLPQSGVGRRAALFNSPNHGAASLFQTQVPGALRVQVAQVKAHISPFAELSGHEFAILRYRIGLGSLLRDAWRRLGKCAAASGSACQERKQWKRGTDIIRKAVQKVR